MAPEDDMLVAASPVSRDSTPLMTENSAPAVEALVPTPTECAQPRRFSNFATVGEALDYAAAGTRGLNFHDPRGRLIRPYPYSELKADALEAAYRLVAAGIQPGDRIALVAETGAEFAALFFGTIYAGAWPVPLPLPTSFGGRDSYVGQLVVQLTSCDPKMLFFPPEIAAMATEAAEQRRVQPMDWSEFAARPAPVADLPEQKPDETAICNIAAARRASRTASPSPMRHCSTISRRMRTAWNCATATAAFRGCPGITTWGSSAASCRRSPTRSRWTI